MELVPFDDRDGWIWWDGALVPWRDAKLHVLTHGLHYASAVFEGERAYAGNIFRLREHTERLIESGRILGFEIPWTAEQIDAACNAVLAANGLTDAYVRPIAWRGSEMLAVSAQAHEDPSGDRRVAVAELFRRRPDGGDPAGAGGVEAAVAGNRADRIEGDRALHDRHDVEAPGGGSEGFADALMLDWRGRVAEATGANILFVMDGEIAYADAGLLPGWDHAAVRDEPGAAAADEGGGAADRVFRGCAARARCSWRGRRRRLRRCGRSPGIGLRRRGSPRR